MRAKLHPEPTFLDNFCGANAIVHRLRARNKNMKFICRNGMGEN
jgi:hypothetical protein